ncbi:arginase [Bacillus glycinifermentans]|uniref:Arginase n=1 Tax=Bacillus glycinifermentans TaxID=1664069 RepID=A0ABU6H202_9BACI|nr:arginase [Bacillus glycinifermentans]ATH92491.1 arginase [Bacillus glycinifermentans]MEC0485037.1 arginase [Bacillus glycinifermentans]MEC3605892.1 arginase [Bacillus glycinifermentans]
MTNKEDGMLRLRMPQWHGVSSLLGAHLLNWLASKSISPFNEEHVDLDASLSNFNKK